MQEKVDERRLFLLAEKAWQLLVHKKMKNIDKTEIREMIRTRYQNKDFNLYKFIDSSF